MTLPPFITKYLKKLPHTEGAGRPDPARDWTLLLSSALLILLASVAWSAWFFFSVLQEPAVAPPPPQTGDDSGIEDVRASFEERAAEEARYRAEYRFIDPSK